MPPRKGTRCFQIRILSMRSHCPMTISMYKRGIPNRKSRKKYNRIKSPGEGGQELCYGQPRVLAPILSVVAFLLYSIYMMYNTN